MWFGAHPAAPSRVEGGQRLDDLLTDSPTSRLGLRVVDAFGPRLPSLMKLLAAEPLSLQVHPTSERARVRFAEQNVAAIPFDAPERSYQDASHKQELVFALTRFEGWPDSATRFCTATILRMLELPWLDEVAATLHETATPFQTLRGIVTEMLAMSGPEMQEWSPETADGGPGRRGRIPPPARPEAPGVEPSSVERESVWVFAQTARLVDRYPEDP
jgi:mannose-6-phosphate isomerase